jgi:hypothetical protein
MSATSAGRPVATATTAGRVGPSPESLVTNSSVGLRSSLTSSRVISARSVSGKITFKLGGPTGPCVATTLKLGSSTLEGIRYLTVESSARRRSKRRSAVLAAAWRSS